MPLDAKEKKLVKDGEAACQRCGERLAMLRHLGRPNEAGEERHAAQTEYFKAANELLNDWEATVTKKRETSG